MPMTQVTDADRKFMQMAIDLSVENVRNGGGPFGAVIVKDGKVIATGTNRVTASNDPTAHAEVSAIREACSRLKHYKLKDCICYTSCEPCPMCLAALYWTGVKAIFFGNTREDADRIGFGDEFIYSEIDKPYKYRSIPIHGMMRNEAQVAFREWELKNDKVEY